MGVELTTTRLEDAAKWAKQSLVERASNWGRKFSLFAYPFVTACCGMEFMSVAGPKYDLARFGAEFPRFSPRQSDLLMVVGTITEKQGPALKRVFDQMAEPKWVIAFGVCASTGGFYQNYSAMPGCDQVIPVDVYIPGCPPRPEQVLDGLIMLQERIQRGEGHNQIVIANENAAKKAQKLGKPYDVPAIAIRPRIEASKG
jgi:NADH-quinone oxidoreductase subunit B